MAVRRMVESVFGSPPRRFASALGIAAVITILTTTGMLAFHWWGIRQGVLGLMVASDSHGGWNSASPSWVWFVLLAVGSVTAVFLAIRHLTDGGGLFGAAAYVFGVSSSIYLYHWITNAFPSRFYPGVPEEFGGEFYSMWLVARLDLYDWWTYVIPVIVLSSVFVLGRWLPRLRRSTRTTGLVAGSVWLGVFLAGYLRYSMIQGILPRPDFQHVEWGTSWSDGPRVLGEFVEVALAEPFWIATVVATVTWLLLSAYRGIKQGREPGDRVQNSSA